MRNYDQNSASSAEDPKECGLHEGILNGHKFATEAEEVISEIMARLSGPGPRLAGESENSKDGGVISSMRMLTSRTAAMVGDLRTILNML